MKTPAREIYDAMVLNEQSRELSSAVEEFRVPDYLSDLRVQRDELACRMVSCADSLSADARDRMFDLIRKHPEAHAAVILLLRTVLEWLEQDRRSPDVSASQRRDLDFVEAYTRDIARFILREPKERQAWIN